MSSLIADFDFFSVFFFQESNQLHACCLDTYPPIIYLNETSHRIIEIITTLNKESGKIKVRIVDCLLLVMMIFCKFI